MLEDHERRENSDRRPEDDPKTIKGAQKQSFRLIIRALCAAYLIYVSVKLFEGLRAGEVAGATRIVSIVACVVFCAVAVILLINCLKTALRSLRENSAEMEKAEQKDQSVQEDNGYGYVPIEDDEQTEQNEQSDLDDPKA